MSDLLRGNRLDDEESRMLATARGVMLAHAVQLARVECDWWLLDLIGTQQLTDAERRYYEREKAVLELTPRVGRALFRPW